MINLKCEGENWKVYLMINLKCEGENWEGISNDKSEMRRRKLGRYT